MANVITYGTFDWFHVGHLRLLQRARSIVRKGCLYHVVFDPFELQNVCGIADTFALSL